MRLLSLALAALALVRCGPPTPPPPLPPEVKIVGVPGTVIAKAVTGKVSVVGCEGQREMILKDGDREVAAIVSSDPEAEFSLGPDVTKGRGFSVDLVLKAYVTCQDGREGTSREVGVSFFPVAQVTEHPGEEQVVTDNFEIEGEGNGTTFLGCGGNTIGTTSLYRIGQSGDVVGQRELPFRCSNVLAFTGKHSQSGTRWAYEPNVGAVAFTPDLEFLSTSNHRATQLELLSNGDALSYSPNAAPNLARLGASGGAVWGATVGFPVIGPMKVISASQARLIVHVPAGTVSYDSVSVEKYDVTNGALLDTKHVFPFSTGAPTPHSVLNADATTLWVAEPTGQGITNTYACAATLAGCVGAGLQWQAVAVPGEATAIKTLANEAQLLVVTTLGIYVFDSASGTLLNARATPVTPASTLAPVQIVRGSGPSYFVLSGTPATELNPYPAPLEIVGVDEAGLGELFRLQIQSGSLAAGLDESGTLWMRVGSKLMRALPLSTYRTARGP